MDIAITVAAAPSKDAVLLDIAAALQRELNGALDFRWLAAGEAMDLILGEHPSSSPPPARLGEPAASDVRGRERTWKGEGTPSEPPQLAPSSPPHPLADVPTPGELAEASSPGVGWGEGDLINLRRFIAEAVGDRPADWCVQPVAGRRKRMLIADMDSTIISQESIDEMAELKGVRAEIAAMTERSMRGEADFSSNLRERMELLRGLTEEDLRRMLERLTLNPGARTLVQTMNAHGAHTVLVSGGFTFFTSAVAGRAGFAADRGNVLLWEDGRVASVAEPILGREGKAAALREEAAAHGISPGEVVAVGDGANDLAMLKAAGLGVAYRAKPIVSAEADAQIRHTDLTALLYFQGYARESFAV